MIEIVDASASAALHLLAALGAGAIVVGVLLLVSSLAPHARASTTLPPLDLKALESHVRHELSDAASRRRRAPRRDGSRSASSMSSSDGRPT
jgi:hypothetical protein